MISKELIFDRIHHFRSVVPDGVELVAVSKFQPLEAVAYAYEAGQRLFGESRVQEFLNKRDLLPKDIRWHFIGHLQTNKVKSLIGKCALIESVDSVRLLELIDKESAKAGVDTDVLLQVHVAAEESKFGFSPEELRDFFRNGNYSSYRNVRICGLMGMATNTEDKERVRQDFAMISRLFGEVVVLAPGLKEFKIISMGMSGDWPLAVEEGSNLIRIGSAIFGPRQ